MGLYDRDYMRAPRSGSSRSDPLLSVRLGIRQRPSAPAPTRPRPAGRSSGRSSGGSVWAGLLGVVVMLIVAGVVLVGGFLAIRMLWSIAVGLIGGVLDGGGSGFVVAAVVGALVSGVVGLVGPGLISGCLCAVGSLVSLVGVWGALLRMRGIDLFWVLGRHDLSGPTGGRMPVFQGLAEVSPWWMLIVMTVVGGVLAAIADPEPAFGIRILGVMALLVVGGHLVMKGLIEIGLL